MAGQITDIGRENIVSSMYLHSHTFLFRNAVAVNLAGSRFNRSDKYKNQLKEELKKIRKEMEAKEHQFYDLFTIAPGDIQTREIAFNAILKKSMEDYKILQALSSPSFYDLVNKHLDTQMLTIANYLDETVYQQLVQNPGNNAVRATLYNLITQQLKNGFVIDLNGNQTVIKRSLRKVYTSSDLEMTKAFKESIGMIFEQLSQNSQTLNNLSGNYYRNVLKNVILNYIKSFSSGASIDLLKAVESACDEVFYDYGIELRNVSSQVGAIGEMVNKISLDALVKKIDNKMVNTSYIGNTTNTKDRKKPPVDFLIDKFGIQAKNSKVSLQDFADIHVMSSLNLETFLDRLAQRLDTKAAQQYGYLFSNIIWLRNSGLNSDDKPAQLKMEQIPEMMSFITDILSRASDVLLAHRDFELEKSLKIDDQISYGNVFFLYRNAYLIPLSKMVDGMIKAIDLDRNTESTNTGVGYFSGHGFNYSLNKKSKEMIELKAKSKNNSIAQAMLSDKRKALMELNEKNVEGYDYPRPIREVGASYGNKLRSGIKVSLTYKLSLKQLAKMTNLYGLW